MYFEEGLRDNFSSLWPFVIVFHLKSFREPMLENADLDLSRSLTSEQGLQNKEERNVIGF